MKCIFVGTILFILGQVGSKSLVPLSGGLKSCKDNPTICKTICDSSLSSYNPVATYFLRPPPACDDEGVCHCYVEQAPGTSDKIRAPGPGEESCTCDDMTTDTIETPSVYHDKQSPESKYCVCFSALRKGKKALPETGNSSDAAQR